MQSKIFLEENLKIQFWGWPIYFLLVLLINHHVRPDKTFIDQLVACGLFFLAFNGCILILYLVMMKKWIWKSVVLVILLYLLMTESIHFMGGVWIDLKEDIHSGETETYYWNMLNKYIGAWTMAVGLVFHIKATINARLREKEARLRHAKEIEAKEMEFAFRTVQNNPHFLMNVLTNLKQRTAQVLPDVAEHIGQIATLVTYQLSASNEGTKQVLLYKEINALQLYLALERSRFTECFVDFEITGQASHHKMVPTTLITLVENAFKYGLYTDSSNPVKIRLDIAEDQIVFQCTNTIDQSKQDRPSMGLGHKIIRTRLDFVYGERYSLEASKMGQDKYHVNLIIDQK